MKIAVRKEHFGRALAQVCAALPQNGPVQAKAVWIKAEDAAFYLIASDGEIELTASIPANIQEPGGLGVIGYILNNLCAKITGDPIILLSYAEEEKSMKLNFEKTEFKYPIYYPTNLLSQLSPFPESDPATLNGEVLCKHLDRVIQSIDERLEAQYPYTGYLSIKPHKGGKVEFCAVNDNIFYSSSFPCKSLCAKLPQNGLIIRKKYAQKLRKWIGGNDNDIELNFDDKRFYARDGNQLISFPRAKGKCPNSCFMSIFDTPDVSQLTISRSILEKLVNLCNLWPEKKGYSKLPYISFLMKPDEVIFRWRYDETREKYYSWEMTAEAKLTGPLDLRDTGFSLQNIQNILDNYVSQDIIFTFTGPINPCKIEGKDESDYKTVTWPG